MAPHAMYPTVLQRVIVPFLARVFSVFDLISVNESYLSYNTCIEEHVFSIQVMILN
jgi:hypothetical protein